MRNTFFQYITSTKSWMLAIIGCFMTTGLMATHVVGGNLTYECLGNDQYEIKLDFIVDCTNGDELALALDEVATIRIFDGNGNLLDGIADDGQLMIPFSDREFLGNPLVACRVVEDLVCFQKQTYIDTVALPFNPDGYIISFRRCCRNNTLLNIVDPLDTGGTYWTEINTDAQQLCNNAAEFDFFPSVYICANEELVFDHSASDIDGDSLVYKVCTPTSGGSDASPLSNTNYFPPFLPVDFSIGYDVNNLMGGVPLTIDASTGLITATPNMVGQFLIGICVEEYRDGVKISETRRDFEYNVRVCTLPPTADFIGDPNPNCDGLDVSFENQSMSTLDNAALSYEWFFDFPNQQPSSTDENPTHMYDSTGVYEVVLITFDGNCQDTARQFVAVSTGDDPNPDFSFESVSCMGNTVITLTDGSTSSVDITDWEWTVVTSTETLTFNTQNPSPFEIPFESQISVSLSVTAITGCTNVLSLPVALVDNDFNYDFDIDNDDNSITLCSGDSSIIEQNFPPGLTISFDPEDGIIIDGNVIYITGSATETTVIEYTAVITNGVCSETENITLTILPSPEDILDQTLAQDTIFVCPGESVALNPNGDESFDYLWSTSGSGTGLIVDAVNPIVSVTETTKFNVEVSVNECSDTGCVIVSPRENIDFSLPDTILVGCLTNVVELNPNGNPNFTYVWSSDNPFLITDNDLVNPVVTVGQNSTVSVVVSDGFCSETFSTELVLDDSIFDDLSFPDVEIACTDNTVILNPNGNAMFSYVWSSVPATDIQVNAISPEVTVTSPTVFTVVATQGACSQSYSFNVGFGGDFDVNLQDTILLCDETMTFLNPGGNELYSYFWTTTGSGIDLDATAANPNVVLMTDTDFQVTITNGDCVSEQTVNVQVGTTPDISLIDPVRLLCGPGFIELNPNGDPNFDYIWSSNDPNLEFDINAVNPMVFITQNTVFNVLISDEHCSAVGTIIVSLGDGVDTAFLPNGIIQCGQDSIFLNPNGNPDYSYEWSSDNPNVDFDPNAVNPEVSVDQTTFFFVEVSDGECSSLDSILVTVSDLPELNLNDQINQCDEEPVSLNPGSNPNYIYNWTSSNDSIVFDNTAPSPTVTVLDSTWFYVTASENGCISTDSVLVVPGFTPIVDFANAQVGCMGDTIMLNPNGSSDYEYLWSSDNPNVIFEPTEVNPNVFVDENTVFTVTVTDPLHPNCPLESTVNVIVPDGINLTVDPGTSFTICEDDAVAVTAMVDDGISIEWQDENGDVISTEALVILRPDSSTFYTVVATDEFGCSDEVVVTVNIADDPNLGIDSSTGGSYCTGEAVVLTATGDPLVVANGMWLDENGNTIGMGETLEVTPTGTVTYTLNSSDQFGCDYSTSITLMEDGLNVTIEGDDFICPGEEATLIATTTDENVSYVWEPTNGIIGDNTGMSVVVSPSSTTVYTVTATNLEGCEGNASFQVEVGGGNPIASGDPLTIDAGDISQLSVDLPDGATVVWSPSDSLDDPNSANPIASPTVTTTYIATVTYADGCVVSSNGVTITVIPPDLPNCDFTDVFLPNMFTPNGDNMNDRLLVYGPEFEELRLIIYDRWGEEVYATSSVVEGTTQGWDGNFRNEVLEPDTYGYHLTVKCVDVEERHVEQGNITLMK